MGIHMICSMTAFAIKQAQVEGYIYCWELKSVNHRYLESSFRLPEYLRFMENNLRHQLKDQIHRGKIDCSLKISEVKDNHESSMIINQELVRDLLNVSSYLASNYPLANDMTISHLLNWPGVLQSTLPDIDKLQPQIECTFNETLKLLLEARATEGSALKNHIKARIDLLKEEIRQAQSLVHLNSQQTKEKLLARLRLFQLEVSEARIEQEIAMILVRLDVSEELDRLQTHLLQVERTLECDKIVGKRLDFLMQELNREANTLSSKSDSSILTHHAVQMKVLIEQMREQIQNIE